MAPALKSGTRPPWVGLGAAVWVQIAAGNSYNFPLYSHLLKAGLGYSQQQVTMLGVANDVGESFGLVPGVFCNKLPPWVLLFVGAASCLVGYGVLWLAVSGIFALPYWVLWIALCIGTNSAAWLNTVVIVTNMKNFPASRGTVAGILKGYVGLSAAVYTQIFSGILHNSPMALLLFLALGIPALCFSMMFLVRSCNPITEEDPSDHGHFLFLEITSVLLGLYVVGTTILNGYIALSDAINYAMFGVMVLLLLAPLAIPIKMTLYPTKHKKTTVIDSPTPSEQLSLIDQSETEPLLVSSTATLGSFQEVEDESDVDMLIAAGEGAVMPGKKKRGPKRGEDFNLRQALVKADFWLLFMVNFVGVGSGITVLNNLAQVGVAVGDDNTTLLLCVLSFCNFVGRLGGGAISEYFVRSRMLPRPFWLTATQFIMIPVYLLYAFGFKSTLYSSTAILGICYGVQWAVLVPTSSELFGLKHFGKIYNLLTLGNPIGAFLLSGVLAGYVYDKEAERQQSAGSCYGPDCFRLTFLVLAAASTLGSVLGVILTVRVKPVYHMLYASGSFRLPQNSQH